MKIREWLLIVFLMLFSFSQSGCSSFNRKLKAMLGGKSVDVAEAPPPESNLTKFSENGDVPPRVRRQYKRTTKETLIEESALDPKTGSLWVMEGQGAYLFSQNVVRLVGDPLAVTLEGDPRDQLQSKVKVIKQLLSKIEERQKARQRSLAGETAPEGEEKPKEGDAAKDKSDKQTASNAAADSAADIGVKTVPTRIVERMLDGNYRIKGLQPFMVGSKEYKIIVTGIVRAEDFNEEGISATKLLDSKFDIVSARRKETEM